ncbi:MAG TPA: SDR family NAD(P)-dependent oxidoreductase [Solirubrobacteraceae bacterium]|nr:SDR family NAD(P)-dependent oxidoreductase [Solirubrobacteraceae bacterium]
MLAAELLRDGLLDRVSVLVAHSLALEDAPVGLAPADALGADATLTSGAAPASAEPAPHSLSADVRDACTALGARVSVCATHASDEPALDAAVTSALTAAASIDLLVVDGAGLFEQALARGHSSHAALRACMDATWNVTRAVVNLAFLPDARGGRIVYLTPAPDAGAHADAARAGLENLSRTLSIEWARHGVTLVTVACGAHSRGDEVAALLAYLASPAGAYFSGCQLDLRGGV